MLEGSTRHDDLSIDTGLSDHKAAEQLQGLLNPAGATEEAEVIEEVITDNLDESVAIEAEADDVELEESTSMDEDGSTEEEEATDEEDSVLEDIFEFELSDDESVELTIGDVRNISALREFMQDQGIEDIADVTGGVLKNADYTQKTQDLAQQRSQLDESIKSYNEASEATAARLEIALGISEAGLKPYEGIDWQQLRADDPIEFAERYQDYIMAKEQTEQVQNTIQQFVTENQAKQQEQHQAYLQNQAKLLTDAIPEFADPVKAKEIGDGMRSYLMEQGFAQEEATVSDHRQVLILRKAMAYDAMQSKVNSAKSKKVSSSPKKVVRAGAKQTKSQQYSIKQNNAKNALIKSGGKNDRAAAEAIKHLI